MDTHAQQKRCSVCKNIKDRAEFYNNRSRSNGITSDCRQCRQAAYRIQIGGPRRVPYTSEIIPNEQWKLIDWIPGYDNLYEVSDHGRVRRAAPGRGTSIGRFLRSQKTGRKDKGQFLQVTLSNNSGHQLKQRLHILVARAFLGPCPPGQEVNHKRGHRLIDNTLDNLEYLTGEANRKHALTTGLIAHGSRLPQCRISDETIQIIRKRIRMGKRNTEIAKEFGIASSHISRIRHNKARQRSV